MIENELIGRVEEKKLFGKYLNSYKSEFIAVYGRRRVGKTFLIKKSFSGNFDFYLTGLANANMQQQLGRFHVALSRYTDAEEVPKLPQNWLQAFDLLIEMLENQEKEGKKVIFLDELPWLDTQKSDFLIGLEYFWNSWASGRDDILLITCGSAASWMIKNLLNNHGGLHNRITDRIHLKPFTLAETKAFYQSKKLNFNHYQMLILYMVFGGIPFYLNMLERGNSDMQNINRLCFLPNAYFRTEYKNLYASLFSKPERHLAIIEVLALKGKGMTRAEIVKKTGIANGGNLTRLLTELEESSFIRRYKAFGKKKRESIYQLTDAYSLFYLRFIKDSDEDDRDFWLEITDSARFYTWAGYAFEKVCMQHIPQIKKALGIGGVSTSVASWQSKEAQIDLLIDRKDQIINICEMKFSTKPFLIDKKYDEVLRRKRGFFREQTGTKKGIWVVMITTYGLVENMYQWSAEKSLTMDVLFE